VTAGIAGRVVCCGLKDARSRPTGSFPERSSPRYAAGQEPKDRFQGMGAAPGPMRDVLELAGIPRLLGLRLLDFLAFDLLYVAFPIYAVQRLVWSLAETGACSAVLSLPMVVAQVPVLSRAARVGPATPGI